MSRPTSFNCVCCPKTVMSCHAQRRLIVCAVQGRLCHATPNVVRLCLRSKGGDVMPRPMSSHRECSPRAVMSCHARHRSPCVLSKGGDIIPRLTLPIVVLSKGVMSCLANVVRPCVQSKGGDVMPYLTSFDRVCCPRAVITCHARRRQTVCAVQGL